MILCPSCESDSIELKEIGSIEPEGHYPSGEERYKQILEYYCLYCGHNWEMQANEFIDPNIDDADVLEPRECYDPDYASEQYRKMIEKE